MADGGYTLLHRKDERGVIVESKVFGPDDEVTEGFGSEGYSPIYDVREDHQAPVAESELTPWESPIAKGTWVGEDNDALAEAVKAEVGETETEADEDGDELDEGSPREAREQSEDGDLTGAEEEVDKLLDESSDEADSEASDETDEGSPRQAREELTDAEKEQDGETAEPAPARRSTRKKD